MGIVSFTPGAAVFWGGLGIMTWTAWLARQRPDVMLRVITGRTDSVAEQAHRWLQERSGSL